MHPEPARQVVRLTVNGKRLSRQESVVFLKLSEGATTAEISKAMDLNPKTINTYKSRILAKLGLPDYSKLIRYAVLWVYARTSLPQTQKVPDA